MFGIAFILYMIRLSAPKGLWYNLRTADPVAHKAAIAYQRRQQKIVETHQRKMDKLLVDKAVREGTTRNPNKLITNLTEIELTKEEIEVLTLGLNHGVALRPREEDILPAIEGLYSRIKDNNLIKSGYMAPERVKNALRSFAWNLIDLEDRHFFNDSKKTRIIKSLRKRAVILKPDKGQGIVLLKKED